MTYAPTMKFHNFINTPKILLLLAIILSGCASLSIYDKTYNLEGKISYVSSENSFIAKAIIKIENEINSEAVGEVETYNKKINEIENQIQIETEKVKPIREKNLENISKS